MSRFNHCAVLKPAVLTALVLAGCAPMPDVQAVISARDIVMNRPNTDQPEALFRMFPDGTGTIDFTNGVSGPQDVTWTLNRGIFCLNADEGLVASFGCARLNLTEDEVTLAHIASDSVVTGTLVAR